MRVFIYILFLVLFYADSDAQSLTIYTVPAPRPLNWKSPHHLLYSLSKNYLAKKNEHYPRREIGHVFVEIVGQRDSIYTSMTNIDDECYNDIVKNKKGLSVLFKKYRGETEDPYQIKKEIEKRARDGKIAFIRFFINDSAVIHLHHFVDSFKILGYDKIYGGMNMPRKGKGAGCSAYAISFLEVIGLMKDEFRDNWMVQIDVPKKLIADSFENRKIRLRELFFTFRWVKTNERTQKYVVYEPTRIFNWINNMHEKRELAEKHGYKPVFYKKAKGLEIDSRGICQLKYPLFENAGGNIY